MRVPSIRGYIPGQPRLPQESHQGARGNRFYPRPGTHEPRTMSDLFRLFVAPVRANIRAGVRNAFPEPNTPPNFAFLISQVKQTPKQGVSAKTIYATLQPPIGERLMGASDRTLAARAQQARVNTLLDLIGGSNEQG